MAEGDVTSANIAPARIDRDLAYGGGGSDSPTERPEQRRAIQVNIPEISAEKGAGCDFQHGHRLAPIKASRRSRENGRVPLHEKTQNRAVKIRPPTRSALLFSDTSFGTSKPQSIVRIRPIEKPNPGNEILVGQQAPAQVGTLVFYSSLAINEYHRTLKHHPGTITSVDEDELMCTVVWRDGEEDYCPTGYKGKFFLVLYKEAKETSDTKAKDWLLEAVVSPRFDLDQESKSWRVRSIFTDSRPLSEIQEDGRAFLKTVVLPEMRKEMRILEQERIDQEERAKMGKLLTKHRKLPEKYQTNDWRFQRKKVRDRIVEAALAEEKSIEIEGMDHTELDSHIALIMRTLKDKAWGKVAEETYEDGLPTWLLRRVKS